MNTDAASILAAHDAGKGDPADLLTALVGWARAHGADLGEGRTSHRDLARLGDRLRPDDDAGHELARRWHEVVRASWAAARGLDVTVTAGPGSVTVSSQDDAYLIHTGFDAVITVEDPETTWRLRMPDGGPDHLVLAFDDVDHDDGGDGVLPEASHVRAALDFARGHAGSRLLVHCHAGRCRSAALALAVLADRLGPGHETRAVADLLAVRPQAGPNLIALGHADALLGRGGDLVRAWSTHEEGDEELARMRFLKEVARRRFAGRSV